MKSIHCNAIVAREPVATELHKFENTLRTSKVHKYILIE